jgi:hypothetical protein
METCLHFVIKLAVCSCALYGVWILLFKEHLSGLWKRMPVGQRKGVIPAEREPEKGKTIVENIQQEEAPQPKDYYSLFLKKSTGTKKQTYISAALYDKISKVLSIVAKDISVPNFIDNVLENHLKEYRDEINDMYRNNSDLFL